MLMTKRFKSDQHEGGTPDKINLPLFKGGRLSDGGTLNASRHK